MVHQCTSVVIFLLPFSLQVLLFTMSGDHSRVLAILLISCALMANGGQKYEYGLFEVGPGSV